MKPGEVSVPLRTAGEEKLAGEPGGRRGWSRRQAEKAAEWPPATNHQRNEGSRDGQKSKSKSGSKR